MFPNDNLRRENCLKCLSRRVPGFHAGGKTALAWRGIRSDFLDLGSTDAIGMAIQRLLQAGKLRRVSRGLYDVARKHPLLGELSASSDAIAAAIARRDGIRLQTTEAAAANLLNLSEQVPGRIVYDSDRRRRSVKVGQRTIEFRERSRRKMAAAGRTSGLVWCNSAGFTTVHLF